MLALTKSDIDFARNQISISKTYYRAEGRDIITTPKTEQSARVIDIPQFLTQELKDYVDKLYGISDDERIFPIVPEAVQHKLKRECEKSGVKKIRVHDLRHPYVKPTTKKFYLFSKKVWRYIKGLPVSQSGKPLISIYSVFSPVSKTSCIL